MNKTHPSIQPIIIDAELFKSANCVCNNNFDKISYLWGYGMFWDCPVHDRETSITFVTRQGTKTEYSLFVIIKKTPVDCIIIICDFNYVPKAIFKGFKTIEDAEVWINQFRRKTTHKCKKTEEALNAIAGLDCQVIYYLMQSNPLYRNFQKVFYFNEEHKIDIANRTDGIVPGLEMYRGYKSTTMVHRETIYHKNIHEYDNRCQLKLDESRSRNCAEYAAKIKAGREVGICGIHGIDAFGGVNHDIRFFVYHNFKQGNGNIYYKENGLNLFREEKIYLKLKKLESGYVVMQKGNKIVRIDGFKSWDDARKWVEEMQRNPIAADKAFAEICANIMQETIQRSLSCEYNLFIKNALTHALSLGPKEAVTWAKILLEILENRLENSLKKDKYFFRALGERDTITFNPLWLGEANINSRIEDIEQLIKNIDVLKNDLLQKLSIVQQLKK